MIRRVLHRVLDHLTRSIGEEWISYNCKIGSCQRCEGCSHRCGHGGRA